MPTVKYNQPCPVSDITITFPSTSGTLQLAGGGGITGFTSQISTAAPNATTNVSQLLVAVSTTNGDITLQAKGNGAMLAQIPDSTATGGNKRGTYAVDFQRDRTANTQVASGSYATIVNGYRNTASGNWSTVVNGTINTASGSSAFVGGGDNNSATGNNSFVGGGNNNQASNPYATIVGGATNSATNQYSFVGGGQQNTNTGTYSSIVGGYSNTCSLAVYALIGGGYQNSIQSSANYSSILGGYQNTIDSNKNNSVIIGGQGARVRDSGVSCFASYYFSTQGDTQFTDTHYCWRSFSAGTSLMGIGYTTTGVSIPTNTSATFTFLVTARQSGSSNVGGWQVTGLVENTGGALTFYNVTVNLIHRSVGTWDVAAVANSGTVVLQVTSTAATVQWSAAGRFIFNTIA